MLSEPLLVNRAAVFQQAAAMRGYAYISSGNAQMSLTKRVAGVRVGELAQREKLFQSGAVS